jgi:asparaginyl-tRNA synthetase
MVEPAEAPKPAAERAAYFDNGEVVKTREEVEVVKIHNPTFGGAGRVRISKLYETHADFMNKVITVAGWARNVRQGKVAKEGEQGLMFIALNDGSCIKDLQVVVDGNVKGFDEVVKSQVGASYKFKGTLVESIGAGQEFELQLSQVDKHLAQVYGHCKSADYPLAGKKQHTFEHLRQVAHLRTRTQIMSSIQRVRNSLAFATHQFFQSRGCTYVHSPIITCSDCEGAGEMFQVTTMLPPVGEALGKAKGIVDPCAKKEEAAPKEEVKEMSKAQLKKIAKQKETERKKAEKAAKASGEAVPEEAKAADEALKVEEGAAKEEEAPKVEEASKAEESKEVVNWTDFKIDYKQDFFSKPSFLTVSG